MCVQGIDDRGCPRPEIPGNQNEERRKAGNGVGDGKWGKERRTVTHHQENKWVPYTDKYNKMVLGQGSAHKG